MVRINRILCPVDFSDFSRHAFDRSVAIAKGVGASVTALHVAPFQATPIYPYHEPREVEAFMLSGGDRDKLTTELKRFLAVDQPIGVPVTCEVVDAPNVHHEILAQAERLPADLIVMGTHGRSGFQRLFLGSVTEKVLRTAQPPVLTVGAATDVVSAHDFAFKRILCAIDFSGLLARGPALCRDARRAERHEIGGTLRHGVASSCARFAARAANRSHWLPNGG